MQTGTAIITTTKKIVTSKMAFDFHGDNVSCDKTHAPSMKSTKHTFAAYEQCVDFNVWNNLTRLTFCVCLLWAMQLCRMSDIIIEKVNKMDWSKRPKSSNENRNRKPERECANTYECNASNIDYHRTATDEPFDTWKDMQWMLDIPSIWLQSTNEWTIQKKEL